MSRKTDYQDSRLTLVSGVDHMLGDFIQLFDKDMENETPEGEGLVFDWSQGFGIEVNLTGTPNTTPPKMIVDIYINEHKANDNI